MRPRILLLGGYGTFGGRIARLIADTDTDILIAGRDLAAAKAFCAAHPGPFTPLAFDRNHPQLDHLRPDLVIDATGPFQAYGADPFALARAALTAKAHYLDLSDGAAFTARFPELDPLARAQGRFALSGASSFPVLTAAVLAEMAPHLPLTRVEAGIAPSPHAVVGRNVLRAVLSYCGARIALPQGAALGLSDARRFTIQTPGQAPLPSTLFTLVEVADLAVLPALFPDIESLWVGAGPRPEPLLRLLSWLAPLRARGLLPDLAPLAPLAERVLAWTRRGAHRGGMIVAVEGGGKRLEWHMTAEGDDGPMIPAMAIELIVRKWLAGRPPAPGARAAALELSLADYRQAFARHAITEAFVTETLPPLPEPVRAFHATSGQWQGEAQVRRHPLAALIGVPPSGSYPLTLTTTRRGEVQCWTRRFGPHRMVSTLVRRGETITENLGAFRLTSRMESDGQSLRLVPLAFRLGPLPLPLSLARVTTRESAEGARYRFSVALALPLIGEIARYEGWLSPAPPKASRA